MPAPAHGPAPRGARLAVMAPRRTLTCPHCDTLIPASSPACPECGSEAETGWSQDAEAWAGDLPTGYGDDPDFDEQDTLRSLGLGDGEPSRAARRRRRVAAVCVMLLACILAWLAWR